MAIEQGNNHPKTVEEENTEVALKVISTGISVAYAPTLAHASLQLGKAIAPHVPVIGPYVPYMMLGVSAYFDPIGTVIVVVAQTGVSSGIAFGFNKLEENGYNTPGSIRAITKFTANSGISMASNTEKFRKNVIDPANAKVQTMSANVATKTNTYIGDMAKSTATATTEFVKSVDHYAPGFEKHAGQAYQSLQESNQWVISTAGQVSTKVQDISTQYAPDSFRYFIKDLQENPANLEKLCSPLMTSKPTEEDRKLHQQEQLTQMKVLLGLALSGFTVGFGKQAYTTLGEMPKRNSALSLSNQLFHFNKTNPYLQYKGLDFFNSIKPIEQQYKNLMPESRQKTLFSYNQRTSSQPSMHEISKLAGEMDSLQPAIAHMTHVPMKELIAEDSTEIYKRVGLGKFK